MFFIHNLVNGVVPARSSPLLACILIPMHLLIGMSDHVLHICSIYTDKSWISKQADKCSEIPLLALLILSLSL